MQVVLNSPNLPHPQQESDLRLWKEVYSFSNMWNHDQTAVRNYVALIRGVELVLKETQLVKFLKSKIILACQILLSEILLSDELYQIKI